jgi:hypothetical protein
VITFQSTGSFENTEAFLKKMIKGDIYSSLNRYGYIGEQALSSATPVESGETSESWSYEVLVDSKSASIIWSNDHVVDGRPIAILLQLGHGTGTGGYVEGRDYINPALRPIFDQIATDVWREVTSA